MFRAPWNLIFKCFPISCLLLFIVAGCAKEQLIHQSSSFNRATATANLEDILLNAARASKDFPLQFTRLTKYTGGNMADGSFSPDLPFGGDATRIFNLKPVLNWSSGVHTIEYGSLNTREGLQPLTTPMTGIELARYSDSNSSAPSRLVRYIAISKIEIEAGLFRALVRNYQNQCSGKKYARNWKCSRITEIREECGVDSLEGSVLKFDHWYFHLFTNKAASKCELWGYEAILLLLNLADFATDARDVRSAKLVPGKDGKKLAVPTTKTKLFSHFGINHVERIVEARERIMKKHGKGHVPLRFYLRSPKGMIQYLGDLIKLQNFHSDQYIAKLPSKYGGIPVVVIKIADSDLSGRVLSIRDDDGDRFYVPAPGHETGMQHLTMKSLTIVSDFFNLRIAKTALPESTSLVFSAN